jgi:hypothetical protein
MLPKRLADFLDLLDAGPRKSVPARTMGGSFQSWGDVNKHSSSHDSGDQIARALGFSPVLSREDAARWGLPFCHDHTGHGRGFPVVDAVHLAGKNRIPFSVKCFTRENLSEATSATVTTVAEKNRECFLDFLRSRGILVAVRGYRDEAGKMYLPDSAKHLTQVIDLRARFRGSIPVSGGEGFSRGKTLAWVKTVTRPDQNGEYSEFSTRIDPRAWVPRTLEELKKEIERVWFSFAL